MFWGCLSIWDPTMDEGKVRGVCKEGISKGMHCFVVSIGMEVVNVFISRI